MEEIIFNYKPMPNSSSKSVYPLAKIDLEYQDKKRTVWPIIDSGASVSIFPKVLGDDLGIDFEGEPEPVEGVIGTYLGYSHYINIMIGDYKIPVRALFFIQGDPYPLLGREGVFNRFDVLYQERLGKVIFIKKFEKIY